MYRRSPASSLTSRRKKRASSPEPASQSTADTSPNRNGNTERKRRMARPKEFDQEKALRKAIRLFSQQGFAATSTDDLMRVMEIGRQSMYDTFGDKRALFLKALELYVTESVHSINVELERPGSALAAVQNALVTFAQRKDLSSAEGCMGLNAISEFGQRDAGVTRITRNAGRRQRQTLMRVLTRAKKQREIRSDADLDSMADFFVARLPESGWRPKPA